MEDLIHKQEPFAFSFLLTFQTSLITLIEINLQKWKEIGIQNESVDSTESYFYFFRNPISFEFAP